jgi:hypothetical protein
VKIYGSLRADDLQRLRPRDAVLRDSGLTGVLSQTKTSGAGRKVRTLPLYIPKSAFLVQERWLEVGYSLWRVVGDPERDFFMPRLRPDFLHYESGPASAGDMAVLNKIVIQELKIPVLASPGGVGGVQASWKEGPYCLVKTPMCNGWTGHSERCTMPSLLASMGVPKAERDPLGRWSPSGSDDYVRTYRALIRDLMARFRRAVSAGEAANFADEDEAIDDARVFASRFGDHTNEEMSGAAGRLSEAAVSLFSELAGGAAHLAPQGEEEVLVGQAVPAHDRWNVVTEGKDDWADFAADLKSRGKDAQRQLLDPRVARELEAEGLEYQPVAPYLIVVNKRIRRLHRTNGCWRACALSFAEFEFVDLEPVPPEMFTHYCRNCWSASSTGLAEGSGEDEGGSSARSSSSEP